MLIRYCWKIVPAAIALTPLMAHAALINQTVKSDGTSAEWNDAIWSTPAAAPTNGNTYQTVAGLDAANNSKLGSTGDLTGRVRAYAGSNGNPAFAGGSIIIVGATELLAKDAGTYNAAVGLNGGVLRFSPNNAANATITGTIDIAADSVLGVAQSAASTFTIASTLTGSSTLRLAAGDGSANIITFDDGVGASLNGFTGILDIGGGFSLVTVGFHQNYNVPAVDLRMGGHATTDRLNLSHHLTFRSFTFGGASLAPGTYSASDLNATFGSGNQFQDNGGSLTVLEALGDPVTAVLSRVHLVGDSTVADWPTSDPKRGWGQEIDHYFRKQVRFVNHALPGRSTKTFITEGRWASTLALLAAGDRVLIQFGHNDSHDPANVESTDANGDYKTYLQQYIDDTRAKAAIPVLVTPMYRRNFVDGTLVSYYPSLGENDLAPYAAAMKQVAVANDVPCIDLFATSGTYMQMLGDEACKALLAPNDPTHWNELGAFAMASLVSQGLSEVLPVPVDPPANSELTQYLRRDVLGMHRADLAAGEYPRPVFTLEWQGDKLWLDWFLQSSGAIIQSCDDLHTWSNDFSGPAGSEVVAPVGPRGFFRVMTP
jgi:lysophospholipase L1-like esterase